jgi:hypothetical protein
VAATATRGRVTTRASSAAAVARPRATRPRVTRGVVLTLLSKLVGLAVLLGASGLLYDLASSPEFQVSRVSVAGNRLLTAEELEATASVGGRNLFWIRRSDVSQRLRLLPPVESATVSLGLPDHVSIQVKERDPVAIWLAGEIPFLVDRDGLVLAARPAGQPLMVVRDTSNQPLSPGSRVSADAVRSVGIVDDLLSRTFGQQPRQYEYAADSGLNVVQSVGPRLILGNGDDLPWKVAAIRAIAGHLEATRTTAELIDVRFGDRPYYR